MTRERTRYISYLLRLWQARSQGEVVWRASLESPDTGHRKGFASLRELFTFLEQESDHRVRDETAPNGDEKGGDAEQVNS